MRLFLLLIVSVLSSVGLLPAQSRSAGQLPPLDPTRVSEISSWLDSGGVNEDVRPFFTPPFSDRAFWSDVAQRVPTDKLIESADAAEKSPSPALPAERFEAFRLTGERAAYEKLFSERTNRLGLLTYAEGIEGKGHRLPAIERELAAILEETSWAVPAHIPAGASPGEMRTRVDLAAATRAWGLATVDYLLGDQLAPETRQRIRTEVRSRVWEPVLARIREGNNQGFDWMADGNNWNAICNAGVMGSSLLLSDSREEHALLVTAFERFTRPYIESFGPDGFCEEGIGYWSYGYGHYTMGSELARIATGGRLDLLAGPAEKNIAVFDVRWQVADGVFPPFGDAQVQGRIPTTLHDFATLRYGGSGGLANSGPSLDVHRHPLGAQLYVMPFRLSLPYPVPGSPEARAIADAMATPPLRDWFPAGGALVVRSGTPGKGLSAAFKGGHNGQSHNHNDLGSYIVMNGDQLVLADLGADTYVKDTFGPKRYTSGVMNSFGHPVPRVAGNLQKTGRSARADTVRQEFTDQRDLWEIDLTSAYPSPQLEKLTRTFIFDRTGRGRLEIIDHVVYRGEAQPFGTAFVLQPKQKVERPTDAGFRVRAPQRNGAALDVSWTASSVPESPIEYKEDPIDGIVPDSLPKGYRVGLDFSQPITEATIRTVIEPSVD